MQYFEEKSKRYLQMVQENENAIQKLKGTITCHRADRRKHTFLFNYVKQKAALRTENRNSAKTEASIAVKQNVFKRRPHHLSNNDYDIPFT